MEPLEDDRSGEAEEPVKDPMDAPAAKPAEGAVEVPLEAAGESLAEEEAPEGASLGSEVPASEPDADLSELQGELAGLNDRHLRLVAEFANYRRRVEKERAALWGRAQGELVEKLLGVLDDLQRVAGLDLGNATVEAILEGIDLVDRKFERILADAGVEVLHPAGERFDPQTMEAVMRVPTESEDEEDRVAMVFEKGYALKGHLLRPARVSVLKLG
ncbi:MAG TPA: nucleotide exchange factor GrpE [Longimicrobiales bacterium]|nr:nucleotide exchange factor GrpE [Longimicrobiales bacterium]